LDLLWVLSRLSFGPIFSLPNFPASSIAGITFSFPKTSRPTTAPARAGPSLFALKEVMALLRELRAGRTCSFPVVEREVLRLLRSVAIFWKS
ncbi:hypothetical protein BKA61DRAFT_622622, partial [Leptodontidium sp. MPI-SDFR-AT-0119]